MDKPFRKPNEIDKIKETEPISTRLNCETVAFLRAEMKKGGHKSFSYFIGTVLEDYAKWLREQKK